MAVEVMSARFIGFWIRNFLRKVMGTGEPFFPTRQDLSVIHLASQGKSRRPV